MEQQLRIGYFAHWSKPPYKFVDFLQEEGFQITEVNPKQKWYLEDFDVVLVEQHGFNDYLENDEPYIQDWVKRGGILAFMHQDHRRWVSQFIPHELGDTMLVSRYMETIDAFLSSADPTFTQDDSNYTTYLMPWIEEPGKRLFSEPYQITPDEMLHWKLDVDTFGLVEADFGKGPVTVRTAAKSCFLTPQEGDWEILGSFIDCSVRDGALIMRGNYGKGMYFLNQILFPEVLNDDAERVLAFWKKYAHNMFAYFTRFKKGESEKLPAAPAKTLPIKRNYKLAIHMHSLDWYGSDNSPGTLNAHMRYMGWDICAISVKDIAPYRGKLDVAKYSDDKVLFLDGQEYHPFNWIKGREISHNAFHLLAIGIDPEGYTTKFTRSFFSDEEIDAYLKEAIDHIHAHGGVVSTAHPSFDYWRNYDIDAMDKEHAQPMAGTDEEKSWLDGMKRPIMNSVDLWGARRPLDNPAVNFIYLNGEAPSRESVLKAIRERHVIAAAGFDEADIYLGKYVPGDDVPLLEASENELCIKAKTMRGPIRQVRVYSGPALVYTNDGNENGEIDIKLPLKGIKLDRFLRVEIEGLNEHWICNSTPFFFV